LTKVSKRSSDNGESALLRRLLVRKDFLGKASAFKKANALGHIRIASATSEAITPYERGDESKKFAAFDFSQGAD
jgi:hypothetical protein